MQQQESAFLQRLRYLNEMTPEEQFYIKLKKEMKQEVRNGRYANLNEFTFSYHPLCLWTAHAMERFSEDGLLVKVKWTNPSGLVSVVIPDRK